MLVMVPGAVQDLISAIKIHFRQQYMNAALSSLSLYHSSVSGLICVVKMLSIHFVFKHRCVECEISVI